MVDGKTQLFADLMIAALDLILVGALLVAVTIMGVWAAYNHISKLALKAEGGDFDEPSD